ncbi:hypothetical protein GCM10022239_16990 [Leifsonia bigeumensis]|uniref:Uncharacterized protein n=1 Tax=Leifsonella bigeumensis TaxID=433643 RepID=A0ABP7FNJ4_9MICO
MSADATPVGVSATPVARRRSAFVRGPLLAWSMFVELFDHVLADSYREGRLRAKAWPLGLRAIVVLAICGYALAVLGIVFSGLLRESLELSVTVGSETLSFPRPVLWMLLLLVVLSMALLQTAALHVSAWLSTAITILVVLILQFASAPDSFDLFSPGRIATLVAGIGLIVFTIVRRRYRFAWWEFVVILPTIGIAFAVASGRALATSAPSGVDFGPAMLSLTMTTLGQLAVPAAIAAGAAVAELSASTALWAVGVVRRRLPAVALVIGLVIVILWRVWALVVAFTDPDGVSPLQLATSLLLIAAIAALWYALSLLRGRRRLVPSASRLVDRMGSVATPIAAALAITLAPLVITLLVVQVLFAYGVPLDLLAWPQAAVALLTTSTAIGIVRLVVGLTTIVLAVILARRGIRTIPELIGGIGVVTVTVAVAPLAGLGSWLWTSGGLTAVATVGCFALLAWFGIRRQLTMRRVTGLAVALLLAAFFDQRDFVSDPLGAVLGFTGVAFVLFGFVWSFLTGGGGANETSRKYPRPARLLLFLANSVFGVTVLAFTALARNPDASINLGAFAEIGDQLFGTGLLVCALLSVLAAVVADRMPPIEGKTAGRSDD